MKYSLAANDGLVRNPDSALSGPGALRWDPARVG